MRPKKEFTTTATADDISRSNTDLNSMRAGNHKFSSLAAEKQLSFHPRKSSYLVYGTENFNAKVKMETDEHPVMLGKAIISEKKEETYLGDVFSSLGLTESVAATVSEKTGKVKGSIYELRELMEDFRMQSIGGIEAAIDLYESSIVPSLLANCATWLNMDKKIEDKLDSIQDLFGRVLLKAPQSTPRLAVRGALGLQGMKFRVWQEKVLLILAIREQEEGCLAKEVLEEQVRMGWPGLGQEVQEICRQTGLEDATAEEVQLDKEAVKEAMKVSNLKYMKEDMTGAKLDNMRRSDMRLRREYTKLIVEEARMAFRLEVLQFDCRANMPSKYGRDLRCRACGPQLQPGQRQEDQDHQDQGHVEDQEHLECCMGYAELWDGLGPATEQSRIKYFMRVQLKRMKQQQQKEQ